MPVTVEEVIKNLDPTKTILLFGAGSSIPSNAPSVQDLQKHFEATFNVSADQYGLAEQTSIIEVRTKDRRGMIRELRRMFRGLEPTGAILNLPLLAWKSIFTTNYDTLIEDAISGDLRRMRCNPAISISVLIATQARFKYSRFMARSKRTYPTGVHQDYPHTVRLRSDIRLP